MQIHKLLRTAAWLAGTLGVLLIAAQPHAQAATLTEAALLQAQSIIPNMSKVQSNFYRGGQPDAAGLKALKDAGVKVDICLDNEQRYIDEESQAAQALGIKFVSIPLNPMKKPTGLDILRFLDIVGRKDDEPVFVHCVHGRDRTGAMVAIYRQMHDHWTPDAAYQEMLDKGFRPFFTNLSNAVFEVGRQLGMEGHKPTIGFIATHMNGRILPAESAR